VGGTTSAKRNSWYWKRTPEEKGGVVARTAGRHAGGAQLGCTVLYLALASARERERGGGPALIKKRTSSVLLLPSHGVRLSHGPELLV
jgi:hypothetical protein